ncbi:MAG: reductive dehalogenase domain-containing protein [Burkholderiaceae bacterium]
MTQVPDPAGFEVTGDFTPFNQKDDVFRRSFHDPSIRSEAAMRFYRTYREPLKNWRKADGFTQKDYALRNAMWHISDLFTEYKEDQDRREGFSDAFTLNRDVAAEQTTFDSPSQASAEIKRVARLVGAADCGVTAVDKRWMYSEKFSDMSGTSRPNDIPTDLPNVIVTVQPMNRRLLATVPSALSGSATGLGYSHDALVVLALAQYIRNLGYQAIASMNDSSLVIPMAIQAGLGEYGRHGLLITPTHGPAVRLGKVFTDLPLQHDIPIQTGVREFCDECRLCAQGCPVKAVPDGKPNEIVLNRSTIRGVRKWSVDGEKCFNYWARQNTDCAICIRVCPYNRDYTKISARLWRHIANAVARRSKPLIRLLLAIDNRLGHGERLKPLQWWRERLKN